MSPTHLAPAAGGADDAVVSVTTLAARPDLKAAVIQLSLDLTSPRPGGAKDWGWPIFLYKGQGGKALFDLCFGFPQYQTLVLRTAADGSGERLVAVGYATPCVWDGTTEGLPDGWDEVIRRGTQMLDNPAASPQPNCVSALAVEVAVDCQGQGLSTHVLGGMKKMTVALGMKGLLAPIRPVLKPLYPLIPMEDYIKWSVPDKKNPGGGGSVIFDPWLRAHLRLGAYIAKVAHSSCTVTGSVAEWEQWCGGLRMLGSGRYTVPGGLFPVTIDAEAGTGIYVEANVWVVHKIY